MAPPMPRPLTFSSLSRQLPDLCRCHYRPFSTSKRLRQDSSSPNGKPNIQVFPADLIARYGKKPTPEGTNRPEKTSSVLMRLAGQAQTSARSRAELDGSEDPHHIHVYAHRHNTHVTLTRPNRTPMLSISSGNIGFKHSQRGSYDAAYQLAIYAMTKMLEKGMVQEIKSLELVLRGYGAGREAFQKALLSAEGRVLKGLVVRVTDATRLKFGGTRSKNVRRL